MRYPACPQQALGAPETAIPTNGELVTHGENGHVTLPALEAHLWASANILRGAVDQADFKSYVFPLLFLKRICDVYDEEFAEALKESDGDVDYASFAENHRFQVPSDAHWRELRERSENVGQAIQRAMREIEKANPNKLYGIFGDTQWSNKERLPDKLLRDLIDHYSKLPLSNDRVEPDVLGNAYEYLIKKFADLSNKKAGEFYTPRSVVRMLVNVLNPQEGETVYDPACGTGGMLIEVVQHVKGEGGRVQLLWGKVFGQEKNLTTAGIARMNLFLHGVEDFEIVRGDTLRDPAFFVGDELATFDCVIANPPFSLEKWGEEVWGSDRFGRNFAGNAAEEERGLRLGPAHGSIDGRQDRPPRRGAASGRPLSWWRRTADPQAPPRGRPRRGCHRPGTQPLLRHGTRGLRDGAAPAQSAGASGQGLGRRRLHAVSART